MNRKERIECINMLYEMYPLSRKLVFDTFNLKNSILTRTQQIILLALSLSKTLTMSQLAKKINTSNEQATRAVAQLVTMDFVERNQDTKNRRIIHISLTDKAMKFMENTKNNIMDELLIKFERIPDDEMLAFKQAVSQIINVLKITES
ncbi:MAG: MarR family transcriptional regulator [Ruminococcus sp.]|nr:MarR family transcriptional regulator [Ruminococcus sp.]